MYCVRSSLPHATRWTSNMHRSSKERKNTWKYTTIYTWHRLYTNSGSPDL